MFEGRSSRLRWLVGGLFSSAPSGRRVRVSGERFADVMRKVGPAAKVAVPDRFGTKEGQAFEISFARPRDFQVEQVVAKLEPLQKVAEIAEALSRQKDPIGPGAAAQRVVRAVGDGPLAQALANIGAGGEAPTPAPAKSPTPSPKVETSGSLDAIFSKVATAEESPLTTARTGVDAFIGAMRGDKRTKRAAATEPRQSAAELVRDAVERSAHDVLGHPIVNALETSWRGLRMIVAAAPGDDDLRIELADIGPDDIVGLLERVLAESPLERPDAVFVTYPIDDIETLTRVAALGQEANVPVVVTIDPALYGATAAAPGSASDSPEAWSEFRRSGTTRWLAATVNPIVLANDHGRLVIGSASLALAAIMAASVSSSGALAATVGRAGAFTAPAAWDTDTGRGEPDTIPTAVFADVAAQRAAAGRGVIVLGSERSSDQVILTAAPTVCATSSAASLPAQVLLGRAKRLAAYVGQRLAPNATPAEIREAFDQAGGAFLPRGPSGAASFEATQAGRGLSVRVRLEAAAAGSAAEEDFDL